MKEHEITIGERTFTFYELKPFDVVRHGMKLKEILARGFVNGMDSNVSNLLAGLDETTLENVIFPILKDCALVCTSAKSKLHTAEHFNEIYTLEDMDEFFELVARLLGVNFGPLVKKTLRRFGVDLDLSDLKNLAANLSKSSSEKTLPPSL